MRVQVYNRIWHLKHLQQLEYIMVAGEFEACESLSARFKSSKIAAPLNFFSQIEYGGH